MFNWLRDRTTSDLLVLAITGTICFSTLMFGVIVSILVFTQPQNSHSAAVIVLSQTLQMLVSLLAGFIAGRSESAMKKKNDNET